jgi:hypothetical protein
MIPTLAVRIRKNDLKRLARAAPERADRALMAVAFEGERYAKANMSVSPSSPGDFPGVDTGTLKNSIHAHSAGRLHKQLRDGVEYGVHLEFGTRRMAARPFMGPTARYLSGEIPVIFDGFLTS